MVTKTKMLQKLRLHKTLHVPRIFRLVRLIILLRCIRLIRLITNLPSQGFFVSKQIVEMIILEYEEYLFNN